VKLQTEATFDDDKQRLMRYSKWPARFSGCEWPSAKAANQRSVLEALLRGEHLTVARALDFYQVYALSQEVGRLKKLGWPIQSKRIQLPSLKNVSEYWL
jgi:hypothetical protein